MKPFNDWPFTLGCKINEARLLIEQTNSKDRLIQVYRDIDRAHSIAIKHWPDYMWQWVDWRGYDIPQLFARKMLKVK